MPWTKAIEFIKSTRAEMERVRWPSKDLTIRLSTIVVLLTLGVGLYVGVLDLLLTKITATAFIR